MRMFRTDPCPSLHSTLYALPERAQLPDLRFEVTDTTDGVEKFDVEVRFPSDHGYLRPSPQTQSAFANNLVRLCEAPALKISLTCGGAESSEAYCLPVFDGYLRGSATVKQGDAQSKVVIRWRQRVSENPSVYCLDSVIQMAFQDAVNQQKGAALIAPPRPAPLPSDTSPKVLLALAAMVAVHVLLAFHVE